MPGIRYRVEFSDGKKAVATALGRIAFTTTDKKLDLAMLKIQEKAIWPYAELRDSQSLLPGEGCVGISYPGSFFRTEPNVRFGRISRLDDGYGYIESTCKMEPGDSGGALFDLSGKLIGVRDKINVNEDENFDIQINLFRKYWTALQKPIDYKTLPDSDRFESIPLPSRLNSRLPEKLVTFHPSVLDSAYVVYNNDKGLIQTALAAHVTGKFNSRGLHVFISKSSLVGEHPWIVYKGRKVPLSVSLRNRENDFVVMQTAQPLPGLVSIDIDRSCSNNPNQKNIGEFVISPLPEKGYKVGIVSTQILELPVLFSRAQLGALLENKDGKVFVKDIAVSYPAEKYLKIGDQILSFNNNKVDDAGTFEFKMKEFYIGDSVALNILRDGSTLKVIIPFEEQSSDHLAAKYEGKRSKRADGFKEVFVQDAAIRSDECGGPVYDGAGKFLGINIARHSRTSTVILPADVIRKLVTYKK
ncbi:trypsin-like peptidase domain-containing protein [Mucilaginibacter sp. RS28]|uniref:Trypsin-like peptidase domain-containing protein n=2 Tax=Mucilaginibacter straminoryzae TaxID=2932774 RepID=A0A9X2B885_9SPHI|nr:trypsin-like peptidase domain-containing protein [Mucilaginibacter straminoryzae]